MTQMIAEGLFRTEGDRTVLIGSRRSAGAPVKFPAEADFLLDGDGSIEKVDLSTQGTLYTFTTQEFVPPLPFKGDRSPEKFARYTVGYVELPEGLLVEGLVVGVEPEQLRIGQSMVTTTTTFQTADGESLSTYAFTPA
ncbi:OB-fold domain-containing protein [Mycolicibacterium fluoranthenivorans]|uniref:OB-fold domain-containing protein n=1 Tax=Mycolicibacterium fluoranthenivorans TaxID=258505 RepID=A0A7G8PG80_9MYCO|nr:OB-fold domain-containing protein [Mycolicibacterium fluoranthenivorans]QNJ93346.1 OB-fold domain-containing protein [Mycolicibacterium fluoranthenivorans]